MPEKFKPLPFNYCNYRCEKCGDSLACPVATGESVRKLEKVGNGNDPGDLATLGQDVAQSLQDAVDLLEKIALEEGISLSEEDLDRVESPPPPETFPLVRLSEKFRKETSRLLEQDLATVVLDEVAFKERIEELVWNLTLISAKLYRALSGKWYAERVEEESGAFDLQDSVRSAQVALRALESNLAILNELNSAVLGDGKIIEIICLAENLKKSIFQEFPDLQ